MIMQKADLSDAAILIVDDQPANVALIERILVGSGLPELPKHHRSS